MLILISTSIYGGASDRTLPLKPFLRVYQSHPLLIVPIIQPNRIELGQPGEFDIVINHSNSICQLAE